MTQPKRARLPGRLRRALPYLAAGCAITMLLAWAVPVLLALRGLGPQANPAPLHLASVAVPQAWQGPALVASRGIFSDSIRATRSGDGVWPSPPFEDIFASSRAARPDGGVLDLQFGWRRLESTPHGWTIAPDPSEDPLRWHTAWTTLAGLPFRAFAGEAWLARADGEGPVATKDAIEVGELIGEPVLLPMRPLLLGLVLDVATWTAFAWMLVALPRAIRRRRRERLGRCGGCGHELDPRAPVRPAACPECGAALAPDPLGFARSPEMHFQNHYVWLVFVSSLDVMLTWKILDRGGTEINPVAALVIDAWGMHGAIAFKFAVMLGVIVMCEVLARLRVGAGRFLANAAVAISAFPVAWSLALLVLHRLVPDALQFGA